MERNAFTSALSRKVCNVAAAVVTAAVYGNWRSGPKTKFPGLQKVDAFRGRTIRR